MLWGSVGLSFPGESLQVPFAQVSPVQICPYMEESLEIFKNASVCTLKYNVFGPEVLLLST